MVDRQPGTAQSSLRVVPASEIHADVLSDNVPMDSADGRIVDAGDGVEYEVLGGDGHVVMGSNQSTVDDPTRQRLSMDEIEVLKREGTGAGKELVARLLMSHSALDQKTAFSLAKYTLRKTRKYVRRFTVLPMDVPVLTHWLTTDKEPLRVMELRQEMLALIGSWANVHHTDHPPEAHGERDGGGRWIVVDDTGGLVVAAMAERMGILHADDAGTDPQPADSAAAPDLERRAPATTPSTVQPTFFFYC